MTAHRRSRHRFGRIALCPNAVGRVLLAVALLLAFAANPIGAVAHAWAHTTQLSSDQGKALHLDHNACELCVAYAALEHTAPAVPLTIVGAALEQPLAVTIPADVSVRLQVSYRPRAPPPLLRTI